MNPEYLHPENVCGRLKWGGRKKLAFGALVVAFATVTAAVSTHSADARALFKGGDFQVNSHTTNGQLYPAVAEHENGSFVIVWASRLQDPAAFIDVHGQRYDSAGTPLGSEFRVNSYTMENQRTPAVAAAADGRFIVSWDSFGQDGSASGVFAQRFAADGTSLGGEFQVNLYTPDTQWRPAVATNAEGSALVVWQGVSPDNGSEIFERGFDSTGTPIGGDVQVNTYTTKSQMAPRVCAGGSGDFVVVWQSGGTGDSPTDQDGSGAGVFGRQFNSLGVPRGAEFRVPSYTTYNQDDPDVACGPNGDFVVVWSGYGPSGKKGGEIFARHFSAEAVPTGPQVQLRILPTANLPPFELLSPARRPRVAYGEDGTFLVAWADRLHASVGTGNSDIVGQFLNADAGQPLGTNFVVTTYANALNWDPAVSGGSSGFVVVWTSGYADSYTQDGSQEGVFARQLRRVPECGDATDDGLVTATDALIALLTSTGSTNCDECVCDADGSGETTASDALLVLRVSIGLPHDLACASC